MDIKLKGLRTDFNFEDGQVLITGNPDMLEQLTDIANRGVMAGKVRIGFTTCMPDSNDGISSHRNIPARDRIMVPTHGQGWEQFLELLMTLGVSKNDLRGALNLQKNSKRQHQPFSEEKLAAIQPQPLHIMPRNLKMAQQFIRNMDWECAMLTALVEDSEPYIRPVRGPLQLLRHEYPLYIGFPTEQEKNDYMDKVETFRDTLSNVREQLKHEPPYASLSSDCLRTLLNLSIQMSELCHPLGGQMPSFIANSQYDLNVDKFYVGVFESDMERFIQTYPKLSDVIFEQQHHQHTDVEWVKEVLAQNNSLQSQIPTESTRARMPDRIPTLETNEPIFWGAIAAWRGRQQAISGV